MFERSFTNFINHTDGALSLLIVHDKRFSDNFTAKGSCKNNYRNANIVAVKGKIFRIQDMCTISFSYC